jgi:hypothetical protein
VADIGCANGYFMFRMLEVKKRDCRVDGGGGGDFVVAWWAL